jgi:hypothetical protein
MADFERNIAALEGLDLRTLLAGFDELRASKRTLGDKPLAILVAGRALEDPNSDDAEALRLLRQRQAAQTPLLRLSSNSVPVIAHNSAHHIPDEAPDTVIRAVKPLWKQRVQAEDYRNHRFRAVLKLSMQESEAVFSSCAV